MATAPTQDPGVNAPEPPRGREAGSAGDQDDGSHDGGRVRMPLLRDVRTRVLVSFLALLLISTIASLFVLREVLLARVGSEAEKQLTLQVDNLRQLAQVGENPVSGESLDGDPRQIFDAFLEIERPLGDGVLATYVDGQVHGETGGPIRALSPTLATLADLTEPQSGEISTPVGDARYVAVPLTASEGTGVAVAAKLLDEDRDEVEGAVRIAAGVSLVVMLISSLFIWLTAGRVVAPLRALARSTREITETDLSGRIEARGNDEIAQLAGTYNDMLDRLQQAFADQKEFLADVGHELRTPITVIRGHLETTGDDPEERAEARAVIRDELERMTRLVDDLLLLARSDRPDFLVPEPLDLDLLTHEIFAKARSLGVRRWLFDGAGLGLVQGDAHRLTSAVMNLAQNAVRHTRGDQAIAIGSSISNGEARLWVRDEGVGIAEDEQQRIFERFAGNPGTPGAGLGLSIVTAIAKAHGGRVELESRPGLGSRFTIVIPTGREEPSPFSEDEWPGS